VQKVVAVGGAEWRGEKAVCCCCCREFEGVWVVVVV